MLREPIIATANAPAGEAVMLLSRRAQQVLPVVATDGTYLGLVTVDVLFDADPATPLGRIADAEAPTLSPDDPLEASGLLTSPAMFAPVVCEGAVVGLARSADAARVVERLIARRQLPSDSPHRW